MRIIRRLALTALMSMLAAPAVLASGFHVYEQGAKASGQAVAFIARADDGSAAFYNPAAAANMEGAQLDFGASVIFLGATTLDSQAGTLSGTPPTFTAPNYLTYGLLADGHYDMKDHDPTPIHIGLVYRLKDTPFAFSFALTNPFGLVTDWSDNPNFAGRYAAWRTDLRTFDYQLNGAMNFGGGWAGSIGIDYVTADLRNFSRWVAVPTANPGLPGFGPYFVANTLQDLEGTGNKVGWNAALHYKSPNWSFGAMYKSSVDIEAKGNISFKNINVIDPLLGQSVPDPYASAIAAGVAKNLPGGGATGTLKLPAIYGLGLAYTGLKNWEFELDVNRIEWNHFENVPVKLENAIASMTPSGPVLTNNLSVDESWKKSTSVRAGVAWNLNANNQFRIGAYTENSPIPNKTLRPSIPDGDRTGATVGYGLTLGKITINAYYLHIFVKDTTVTVADTNATQVATGSPTADLGLALSYYNNAGELGRTGTYKSGIDLVGITANWKF